MYLSEKDVVSKKFEAMSNEDRRALLLEKYPAYILDGKDDTVLYLTDGNVRINMKPDGSIIDIEYVASDR